MIKIKLYILVLIRNNSDVFFGMKKRGFGVGWWNGFGGKVYLNEIVLEVVKR